MSRYSSCVLANAQTAAQIQDQINASPRRPHNAKWQRGLCATVLMPVLSIEKQELPGPYLHLKCTVRVQENVIINMGANGTQIPCEDAAINVAQSLHLWTPGGTAGSSARHRTPSLPIPRFQALSLATCWSRANSNCRVFQRPQTRFMTNTAGNVSINCADPAAEIWYTLRRHRTLGGQYHLSRYRTSLHRHLRCARSRHADPRGGLHLRKTGFRHHLVPVQTIDSHKPPFNPCVSVHSNL